jgi:hypothetical protein
VAVVQAACRAAAVGIRSPSPSDLVVRARGRVRKASRSGGRPMCDSASSLAAFRSGSLRGPSLGGSIIRHVSGPQHYRSARAFAISIGNRVRFFRKWLVALQLLTIDFPPGISTGRPICSGRRIRHLSSKPMLASHSADSGRSVCSWAWRARKKGRSGKSPGARCNWRKWLGGPRSRSRSGIWRP